MVVESEEAGATYSGGPDPLYKGQAHSAHGARVGSAAPPGPPRMGMGEDLEWAKFGTNSESASEFGTILAAAASEQAQETKPDVADKPGQDVDLSMRPESS